MGNIQASDGGGKSGTKSGQKIGSRSKMRLLSGKKVAKVEEWTNIATEKDESDQKHDIVYSQRIKECFEACKTSLDSNLKLSPAQESLQHKPSNEELCPLTNQSSFSNLTPLSENCLPCNNDIFTPVENIEENDSEVFQPLNVFKLNEYRTRIDQKKVSKLSKLGITTTSQISLEGGGTGFSTGVLEITEPETEHGTNKDKQELFADQSGPPTYRRHMSVPLDVGVISEELNLQRTSSLSRTELEARLRRPQFVPEKLDFKLYEKFEGYMLLNWYLSELSPDSPARAQLGMAELKLLASQFCTHLLAAGVLKQLPDPGVPTTNFFRPDCIYFWSHAEVPQSQPQTPGKLNTIFWPPLSPCNAIASPKDLGNNSGFNVVSLSYQEKKSSARDVEILLLEEEIKSLHQEVDKYKTLIEIQNLTASAVKDFGSPSETNGRKVNNLISNGCLNENLTCDVGTSPDNIIEKSTRHIEVQTEKEKKSAMGKCVQTEYADKDLSPLVTKKASLVQGLINDLVPSPSSKICFSITSEIPPPIPPPLPDCVLPLLSELLPFSSTFAVHPPAEMSKPPILKCGTPLLQPLSTTNAPTSSIEWPSPPQLPPPCIKIPPPPPLPCIGMPPPPPPLPCIGMPPPPPPPLPCIGMPPPPPPPLCIGIPPPPPPPPPCLGTCPPLAPYSGQFLSSAPCLDLQSLPNIGETCKPPPPHAGPLPMPAPPLGGFNPQKAAMKKPAINPPVPMKPLYWTRILVAQTAKSDDGPALWEEIEELPLDFLPEDFTELFSRHIVNRIPNIKKQEQNPKVEVVKLLDSKRSQSVGILAQSLRQDFHEIENAIYSFDTSVVSLEALQQIYEVRATPEELSLINGHLSARPHVPLDKPEQFLYDLSQIADFAERITCLTFQVDFEDTITTIGHTLDSFLSTCEFLTKSPELKRVLSLILTLGNYMNGGNVARGQADGFGLEVLSRLKDVKGSQTGITLLHFVVRTYVRNFSEDDELPPLPIPEPGDVRRAMALDFDAMGGELHRLKNKFDECEKRTKEVIANSTPDNLQPFKDKMEIFLEKSRTQHKTECENLRECREIFLTMMKLYLFKPKSGTAETFAPLGFFELWLPFCGDFKDIYKKEIIKIQIERAQDLKRKERHEANMIRERENGLKAKFKKARARLVDKLVQDGGHDTL